MKAKFLLFVVLSAVVTVHGQTYEQTHFVLKEELPGSSNIVYEATTSIKLLAGFRCNPEKNKSVMLAINRFNVCPPEEGVYGGPPLSNHDGVVGAMPGELKINDFGGAVYTIPILMPHGIGNMTPNIAVTYNNQAGNGLLGWGWNVSGLSSIVRTGQTLCHDNNETAVNFMDDRFVIDGQRLMLCSGNYGENGSVYKTEIDKMSKIVAYSEGYSGPARFEVYKKDGTIWEYGNTDDSRIEPQGRNDVVLTWLVNKVSDRDGNYMIFNYIENQNNGEWYISSIDYTLNENAGIHAMFRIEFVYDDRSDVEFGYEFENIVRRTKILKNIIVNNVMTNATLYDYSFGYIEPGNYADSQYFMYYRLRTIGLSANGMKLNPTVISWNSKKKHYPENFESFPLSKNMFNKVPFVGDFNGDGYSDVALVPYKTGSAYPDDVLVELHLNNGDGTFDGNPLFTFEFEKTLEWLYIVDLDGDGLDDFVPYFVNDDDKSGWKSSVYAYINKGNTFQYVGEKSSDKYFIPYSGDFCHERKTCFFVEYMHDANGSTNCPEIFYYADNQLKRQTLGQQAFVGEVERVFVADIDSDHRSEIMLLKKDKAIVATITKENGQYVFNNQYSDYDFDGYDFMFPGDFNGDGHVDVLKYDDITYWKVAFSDGNRLKTPVSCLDNNLLNGLTLAPQDRYCCSLQSLSMPSETIRTADFDGDGKTDVAVFKNTGGNYYVTIGFKMYEKADGGFGFGQIKRFYLNINNSHQFVHVGNFLGRENASILGSVRSNPFNYETPKIVSLYPQSAKYSVERVTDGLGNARGFKYEYLMPNNKELSYEYDYQWINDDVRTVALPVRALYADTVFSANNNPNVTKYSYKNMLYNNMGHGLLGFEMQTSKCFINNQLYKAESVENDMNLVDGHDILLPKTRLVFNYNNQIVNTEQYSYSIYKCAHNIKILMPLLTCKIVVDYDKNNPGAIVKTRVENIDYKSDMSSGFYADVVNVASSIAGEDATYTDEDAEMCSYWAKTDYSYNNKVANWIVSRPKKIIKSQHYADYDEVGSCELFEYSNNNSYQIKKITCLPNAGVNYNDPLMVVKEYSYDAVGHAVMQSLTSPSSKNQRVTRLNYGEECNYRLPTTSINEKGWEVHNTYDNNYGILHSTLDYNQFEMESSSDPFEITVENILPGGIKNVKTKRWAGGNEHAPEKAMYYCWEKTSGKAETMTFYNKNGNKLREVSLGLHGEPVYVDFTYDDKGNTASKSNPYKKGDDIKWYYFVYDNNNRLVEEIFPNGLTKTYSYNQLQTAVCSTSQEGVSHTVVETTNPMGWRTQVVDIGGNTINYEYFSDGNIKSAMIDNNTLTKVEYGYDNLRNISRMKDPSCGEVLYEYNAFGELVSTTNPKQCVTTYEYDLLGNVVARSESDAKGANTVVTRWVYDDKKGRMGMLAQINYGQLHSISYDYDELLRVTNVHETIQGTLYSTSYTYDKANREEQISYPSGLVVRKNYSNSGLYLSMTDVSNDKTLWRTEAADAMGYITEYQLGNSLKTQRKYDEKSNLLSGIYTFLNNNVYQDLQYSYDGFGNLVNRAKMNGTARNESFVYDDFNRLVEIRMNNLVTGNMAYDDYGNILSKNADKKEVFYDAQYYSNNPYAIQKAKSNYENLIAADQTIEYTNFDKMSYIVYGNNSLSIDYGFDHERIHSEENVGGVITEKTYVGDCEYVVTNGKTMIYTFLAGPMGVFAVCSTNEKGDNSMLYVHKDHLNSWCLVTDDNGQVVQDVSFDAWGNLRNGDSWSGDYNGNLLCDRGFTGHEHLQSFGIINMNGRAYDPIMSMMMSPDSYIQNLDFSQNYNRYIYCYNNPLSYSDPSGEWVEWLLWGVFQGTMNVINNCDEIDSFTEGAMAFGAGFVSGCLSIGLSECSWALQVVGNVAGETLKSGVNYVVEKNTDENHIDWSVVDNDDFKSEMMYSFGSNLAKSVLNAYIVAPDDANEDGVTLANKLCRNKVDRLVLETTSSKIAGNLFAGKKVFDGLNCKNWNEFVPYARCLANIMWDGLKFEGGSAQLTALFDKVMNVDLSGNMRKFSSSMNNCYSLMRSLFFKN
jgi:RHS repeat-associated protein